MYPVYRLQHRLSEKVEPGSRTHWLRPLSRPFPAVPPRGSQKPQLRQLVVPRQLQFAVARQQELQAPKGVCLWPPPEKDRGRCFGGKIGLHRLPTTSQGLRVSES